MAFLDLFSENADLYATARPRYPEELFTFIAALAPARSRAWDCGTGNGQAAVSLAEHFAEVVATDPSEEQIAHATRVGNIRYSVQSAEETDLVDRSIDAICVAQALHWFEFKPFFAEVRRVAVPGAIFIAWGYDWFSVSPEFDTVFRKSILDVVAPYWALQNQILWTGYANVPLTFPRLPTPEFRILARWDLHQLLAYVHTWSATRRCIAALGTGFFEIAGEKLAPLWGNPGEVRAVSMPLHLLAGRVS